MEELKFGPHPNMKKLYYVYLTLALIPLLAFSVGLTVVVWIYSARYVWVPIVFSLLPVLAGGAFVAYWIPKYYASITYTLTGEEIRVERGVWWKFRHTVPYSRVMSVDTVQGPISRHFGVGTVDVYTAGYTGAAGGRGGPGARRAEASIMNISNFTEVRELILQRVRSRPLFGVDVSSQILEELRRIRETLEKKNF